MNDEAKKTLKKVRALEAAKGQNKTYIIATHS